MAAALVGKGGGRGPGGGGGEGREEDPWRGKLKYHVHDLSGGLAGAGAGNVLLSENAKAVMHELHRKDPAEWTAERLAKEYRVRPQRVLAILALRDLRARDATNGRPQHGEYEKAMHAAWGKTNEKGPGEQHFKTIPSYPRFEPGEPGADAEEQAGGWDAVSKKASEEEERTQVREFRQNLDYNMARTGPELNRQSRVTRPTPRPEGGWSYVVTYLGKEKGRTAAAFTPDGAERPLSESEQTLLNRRKVRPRRRTQSLGPRY